MLSLLYISRVSVPAERWDTALVDIQTVSIARNAPLDITGLLIATPDWFAQRLEGPPENIDRVMMSILADPRHHAVHIARRAMIARRSCPLWRLARFDRGMFEATYIYPVLEQAHEGAVDDSTRGLDRLIERILLNGLDAPQARIA